MKFCNYINLDYSHKFVVLRLPAVQLQRPFSGEQVAPFLHAHFCAQSSPKVSSGHNSLQSLPR